MTSFYDDVIIIFNYELYSDKLFLIKKIKNNFNFIHQTNSHIWLIYDDVIVELTTSFDQIWLERNFLSILNICGKKKIRKL